MSRRVRRCLTCKPWVGKFGRGGFTRHDNRVCSACRSRGITANGSEVVVPLDVSIFPSHTPDECFPGCTEHYAGRYA